MFNFFSHWYNTLGRDSIIGENIINHRIIIKFTKITSGHHVCREKAEDYGGPRREFFSLLLRKIKEKYFDSGFIEEFSEDYVNIGLIFGLSVLQNGKIPKFMTEDQLSQIFSDKTPPNTCLANIQKGLGKVGIQKIAVELPAFIYLFRPTDNSALSLRKFISLFKVMFADEGSNKRKFEEETYKQYLEYTKIVASGRRDGMTLEKVLMFVTGCDEEPLLGYSCHPKVCFAERDSLLPTANTCINQLVLTVGSIQEPLPGKDIIFNLFDYGFSNSYFGLI